ncbi:MAG: L-serine ammonia-lyase, iron-sulfur-dependent subunit beta [Clostridia bacterium]|nr:L-serine ammonia-lyase, iron-sulfur-dependent subunit beta [Clostridia bacterium]
MTQYSFSDILGPIMIGPSSSHTAGAAKLALIAKHINSKPFHKILFKLHGSFAKTYKGHGTDKALIGGILGFEPDDIRLRDAYDFAVFNHVEVGFESIDLDDAHVNSVQFHFYNDDETINIITGSSLGGGAIKINNINDFKVSLTGDYPTIIVKHIDKKGVLSALTTILSKKDINIATMEVSRTSKNKAASIVIECDDSIPEETIHQIENLEHVIHVKIIDINKGDTYV